MSLATAGPGKTAPKLLADFLAFDPLQSRPNILTNFVPPQGEGVQLSPGLDACRHEYATKSQQSCTPALDLRPDGNTRYKLALVCKKCRIHADIRVDYSQGLNPCPSSTSPLHHFQQAQQHTAATTSRITYDWQCSVEDCHARLVILYRPPRTSGEQKDLLANPNRLKRRYEALLELDPTREGVRQATEIESLTRLRRYIRDSLDPDHVKRQFPGNNKRFQEAFGLEGEDCRELFEKLGFKYAVSLQSHEQDMGWDLCDRQDYSWTLPNPDRIEDRLSADGDSQRELLEDVEIELLAWMYKVAAQTGLVGPGADKWVLGNRDIERTLGVQGYQRHNALRRPSNEELPFFNSLGARPEFADALIEFAYERQIICDPEQTAYYFECLQVISSGRNSEQLNVKVATLESQDVVSRRDLKAAYSAFNILPRDQDTISDSKIIDQFQALLGDQSVAAQQQSREHLAKIGTHRHSSLLINTSRQSVETYEDALTWLGNGVTKDTADEGLLAVLSIKVDGHPADEEIGKKAISVIARARKSEHLNNWLATGQSDGWSTMNVDEALRHLGIEQKLHELEPTMVPIIFQSARTDRPGEMTEKAITAIQTSLSNGGGATNGSGGQTTGTYHAPETWPVGLTSHGNTCYLNSLLQYYFSIQPLRDIILNYEQYQADTSGDTNKEVRVGQRHISKIEVEGGQRFAQDLKHLFQRMIKDRGPSVKPDSDLVCRAFLPPQQYYTLNVTDIEQPGEAVQHDDSNCVPTVEEEALIGDDTPMEGIEGKNQSTDSSQTLQGDADMMVSAIEKPPSTPPDSPDLMSQDPKPEPEHAPPLPPRVPLRRFSTTRKEALGLAEARARAQHDVTEVHDDVMFRLRSGMIAKGSDTRGEQLDQLRDLFNITTKETRIKEGKQERSQVQYFDSLMCQVPRESTDLYNLLDEYFDLRAAPGDNSAIEDFTSIEDSPSVLQINIGRAAYDDTTKRAYKSTELVYLHDELYLDRYIDQSHTDTLKRRRQCWEWKRQLRVLQEEKKRLTNTGHDMNSPTMFQHAANYLTGLDEVNRELEAIGSPIIEADGDITSALNAAAKEQSERLDSLEREVDVLQKNISGQFDGMRDIKYRLAAVFFHLGDHGSGHYWLYIHDFQNGVWRKYNDETVEEYTTVNNIYSATERAMGTPTYAAYVAEDRLQYVQPVCRDPEKEQTPEPNDVQMGGEQQGWTTTGDYTSQWGNAPPEQSKPQSQMEAMSPHYIVEGGHEQWDESRMVPNSKW